MMNITSAIRDVQDFPKKGIVFKDITTLLKDPVALHECVDAILDQLKGLQVNKIVGIESRGFIIGAILAHKLGVGFIPVRKPGKLPSEIIRQEYQLEYGTDAMEIHVDAIQPGDKVIIHDDLLATGGTVEAACKLVEKLGGKVIALSFIIELSFLHPRNRLSAYPIYSLVQYNKE